MGKDLKIVIVDDDSSKIQHAEDTAHAVFPAAELKLIFMQRSDLRSDSDLALDIMRENPQIVILDNTLITAADPNPLGGLVAMKIRLLSGGKDVHICMHSSDWEGSSLEKSLRRRGIYGASPRRLQAELQVLKAEKFPEE